MAQIWLDNPRPSHLSPDDMAAMHLRSIMYNSNRNPVPFYPESPYGMAGLGSGNCADPFIQINGAGGSYACACPDELFTLNDSSAGRQCVPECPGGTIPGDVMDWGGSNPYPTQSRVCVADPNVVKAGQQINLQTGQVEAFGTGTLIPATTPTDAPTPAPGNQPGNIPATTGVTPLPPPLQSTPDTSSLVGQGTASSSPASTTGLFGLSDTALALIAAGVLGVFLLSKGGK